MEHLKDTMNQNRGVLYQREAVQPTFHANLMGCDTLSTMNRRMRSRMSGGVGIGRR